MDRIGGKVNRAARLHEVVKSNTELRRKIPDAGAAGLTVRNEDIGRILVRGVDQSTRALKPRGEMTAWFQVPAQDDRRDADPGEGSSTIREIGITDLTVVDVFGQRNMRRGCEGLPVGHDLDRVFELAAQNAGQMLVGDHLTGAPSGRKKAEVGAIARADATLQKSAELPRIGGHRGLGWSVISRRFGLCRCIQSRCNEKSTEEAKSFHTRI